MQRRQLAQCSLAAAIGGAAVARAAAAEMSETSEATELASILERLNTRDVPAAVEIPERLVMLERVTVLATLGTVGALAELERVVGTALKAGLGAAELREAAVQGMAYSGLTNALAAERVILERAGGPVPEAGVVTDADRFENGLAVQKRIFGEAIDKMHVAAKPDEKALTVDLLTGYCFGDTYTRKVLTLAEREWLTFCAIAALGGCEPQVKAHAAGNIAVGNTRRMLVDALIVMLPYVGFPKVLNALAMVNEAISE